MVFQEPMTSLNPVLTIGQQLSEPLLIHLGMTEDEAKQRCIELLGLVGIADAEQRLNQYPHQFSGGMRQRVMIAIALACNPRLIIADEPTTALDVTIQAQILELMKDLSRRLGITLVIITHNLGVVARYADRVAVMYAGRLIEQGSADSVFISPRHPYTYGLLRSVPRLDEVRAGRLETIEGLPPNLLAPPAGCRFAPRCRHAVAACEEDPPLRTVGEDHIAACHFADRALQDEAASSRPTQSHAVGEQLLDVRGLIKHFHIKLPGLFGGNGVVRAVQTSHSACGVAKRWVWWERSGCGKSTIGRLVLRLEDLSAGKIIFDGQDLASASARQMREMRKRIQVIFQDPFSSLNPRMTVSGTISEPLRKRLGFTRKASVDRVAELLEQVGLRPEMADRYPHQLSGGQRQRVGIARALAMEPDFIVCDEPVSALDVSIQGQIVNLLQDLQTRLNLAFLFIAMIWRWSATSRIASSSCISAG